MKSTCYQLDASEVIQGSGIQLGVGTELFVGLLSRPPAPEGIGAVEISGARYVRQPVTMVARTHSSMVVVSNGRVVFAGADQWEQPTHAALFNGADELIGYGILMGAPGVAGSGAASFGTGMIRLRVN